MRLIDADALKEKIEQSDGEGTIARYCKRVLAECLDNDAHHRRDPGGVDSWANGKMPRKFCNASNGKHITAIVAE